MKGWQFIHLYHGVAFAQASTDTGAHLKTPAGFHAEDYYGHDVSD